jgi:methyltransferase (TIGR00027 family)
MHEYKPSRTALGVAVRRAAHQLVDHPKVFDDPLALAIIGAEAASKLQSEISTGDHIASQALRAFVAVRSRVRSRYAEDQLAKAVDSGVRQYVVLGAGLDTFAYRNPHASAGLRVFEVDHPPTQSWKQEQLKSSGITIPPEATFVPVDFEQQLLGHQLQSAGFRADQNAFFAWLGVVPYLTEGAFTATASYIAAMPPGSGVVFDYGVAKSALNFLQRRALDAMSQRVARAGEAFQVFFDPAELAAKLTTLGFHHLEDLGVEEINTRYFRDRSDGFRVRGGLGRLISAWV